MFSLEVFRSFFLLLWEFWKIFFRIILRPNISMMFLYNVLIKFSMKFIVTQREWRVITFEYYDSRRPPWKSVAPVQFSLSLSQSYNPHKRSYLSSRAVEKSHSNKMSMNILKNCLIKPWPSCTPFLILFTQWKMNFLPYCYHPWITKMMKYDRFDKNR